MIVKAQGFQIDTDSICFSLMYRCMQCNSIVNGSKDNDGCITCEKCHSQLEDDDEVAYRLDGDD
ncbi:hypothetical protein ACYFX5_22635 [Bremerella sp. T1]|uniref:hypothetical protein n=1 Tax=Bremerella sp. TYQ1 TaxID=3119568 RepID=UPI001CCB0727|nr:hypothetical protein [Bremerella volcania]UBM35833.1 hypothetical protein LA756_24575 [Bremerella volcania]